MRKKKLLDSHKVVYLNKSLSMDEYVEFVNSNLKHHKRKKMSKSEWLATHSGVPFAIK